MGAIVTVHETFKLERTYGGGKTRRFWTREPIEPRAGWVVGYRTIFDGTVESGYGGYPGEDYDPPYLKVEKSHRSMLVAFTPYSKPVHVPDGGWDETATMKPQSGVSEKDREFLSKESKNWPRNAKGQFSK